MAGDNIFCQAMKRGCTSLRWMALDDRFDTRTLMQTMYMYVL